MKFEISITFVINSLIVMLITLLVIYPSWLIWQNAHFITRLSVILFISLGIYFYMKGLNKIFEDNNTLININQNDLIVILLFGIINYLSLQTYRNGKYSIIGDEYGHSIGAVLGYNTIINNYKEYILLMILLSAIVLISSYKYLPKIVTLKSFIGLCIFIAIIELASFKLTA